MAEVGVAYLTIAPSASGFRKALEKELGGDLDGFGKTGGAKAGEGFKGAFLTGVKGLAAPLAALTAGAGLASFFSDSIAAASDLNEAGTKLGAVFGDGVAQVNKFAAGGAKALGQSRLDVLNAAATFGVYGKAAGLGDAANADFSTSLVSLSTDLASFYNTDPSQAMEALAAGLRGETEPLRQFGVLLDDATLRQKALEMGLIKTTKDALTPQQKVLAAQASIMEQTSLAQGDFERTSGGLANQQRILAAQFEDVKARVGDALLPTIVSLVTAFNEALPGIISFGQGLASDVGPAITDIKSSLIASAPAFKEIGTAVLGLATTFLTQLGPVLAQVAPLLANNLAPALTASAPAATSFAGTLSDLAGKLLPLAPYLIGLAVAVKTSMAAMAAYRAVVTAITVAKQAYALGTYGQATAETALTARLAAGTGLLQARAAAMLAATRATLTNIAVNVRWQLLLVQQSAATAASSAAAWVAAAARTSAAWVATQARLLASFVAAGASAVAQAAISAGAWVAASARTVAAVALQSAAFVATRAAMLAGAAASGIATAAQWALNAALNANPIGLVVLALAALVAGVVLAYKNSETFRNVVNAAWAAVKTGIGAVATFITGTVVPAITGAWDRIKAATKAIWDGIVSAVRAAGTALVAVFLNFTLPGLIIKHWDSIKAATAAAWTAVKTAVANAVAGVVATGARVAAFVTSVVGYFTSLQQRAAAALVALASAVVGKIAEALSAAKEKAAEFVQVGKFIIEGVTKGISNGIAAVKAKAREMAEGALSAAKKALGIASPSKEFIEVGQFVNAGLIEGLTSTASKVEQTTKSIADNIYKGFKDIVGRQIDAQVADIDASVAGLKRQIEALSKTAEARKKNAALLTRLNAQITDLGNRRTALNDSIESVVNTRSQGLLDSIASQTDYLALIARNRDAVAEDIKAATKRLEDAVKLRDDFAASIASSAAAIGALTSVKGLAGVDGQAGEVTFDNIVSSLSNATTSVDSYRQSLETLRNQGLSDNLFKQLADAGATQGKAYVDAIIAAGPGAVAQLNELQTNLGFASQRLGDYTSRELYQAGVDSAQGLIDGLKSREANMYALAEQIASGIADRIRKALDIHSPSRVMAGIGEQIGAGLAKGMDASRSVVAKAADRLFQTPAVPAPRVPSAVRAPAGVGTSSTSSAGGAAVFNLYDADDVLIGTMSGVAGGAVSSAAAARAQGRRQGSAAVLRAG